MGVLYVLINRNDPAERIGNGWGQVEKTALTVINYYAFDDDSWSFLEYKTIC